MARGRIHRSDFKGDVCAMRHGGIKGPVSRKIQRCISLCIRGTGGTDQCVGQVSDLSRVHLSDSLRGNAEGSQEVVFELVAVWLYGNRPLHAE